MPTTLPETTSVETLVRYIGGDVIAEGRGEAWAEVKAWIFRLRESGGPLMLPTVSEPFLAWTLSGESDFHERENDSQPWLTNRIRKGSYFLTSGGAPYECRWQTVTAEPLESMAVFIEIPLLERAMLEVFGPDAPRARLRDLSGFTDPVLDCLMERLREEVMRRHASPLYVQGLGQAIAIHLARHYAEAIEHPHGRSPSLPGFRLKQITDWMAEHFAEDINLDQLAARAGLSKFHFHRLFKSASGLSPSRFHLNLRMDAARRLLRETKKNVVVIALEVGYTNASHFAQLFRREVGLTPSEYRRQR